MTIIQFPIQPPVIDATDQDLDWRGAGACIDSDPDAFFEETKDVVETCKRICASCPVRALCLDEALRNREGWGTWGGTTAKERAEMTTRQRRAVQAEAAAALAHLDAA